MAVPASAFGEGWHGGLAADEFRQGMRQLATPVALATTCSDGERAGLTVSSFCSLSAEPPRLLLCVNRQSATFPLLRVGGVLALNVLRQGQQELAMRFASGRACPGERRFAEGKWQTLVTGAPVLADSLVVFDCSIVSIQDSATHGVVIADILAMTHAEGEAPLLYRDGGFLEL